MCVCDPSVLRCDYNFVFVLVSKSDTWRYDELLLSMLSIEGARLVNTSVKPSVTIVHVSHLVRVSVESLIGVTERFFEFHCKLSIR